MSSRAQLPEHDSWREPEVLRYLYRERSLSIEQIAEWAPEDISPRGVRTVLHRAGIERKSRKPSHGLAKQLWDGSPEEFGLSELPEEI